MGHGALTDMVERRLLLDWAMRLMDALPSGVRECFTAHALHGHSYADIGQALGITEPAARQRVAKARRMLAAAMERAESGGAEPADESDRSDRSDGSDPSDPSGRPRELGPLLDEIAARIADTCVIHVPLPTGGRMEFHADFEHGLSRRAQRIATLEAYVAAHERGWRRRLELANLLLADNRVAEAEAQYRETLRRQPRVLQAALRLGQLLALAGRGSEAAQVYSDALRHVTLPATQHHLRGLVPRARSGAAFPQHASGQRTEGFERAVAEFRAAITEEPRNLSHHHELALTYEAWGKVSEALAAYDAALAVDPNDVYALARCHNAASLLGRYDLIVERLERAVAIDPNYTYAVKLLADRRANMGLVRGAEGKRTLALLKRVLARNPDSADAWDAMTRYYDFRCELERSVAIWRAFIERNPENAKAWTFYGTALDRVGERERAADAYMRSHSLDPGWLDVYWRGTAALILVGRTEEARRWVEELRARFPDHWGARILVGEYLRGLGADPEEYLAEGRRAIALQPGLATAWMDYGNLLLHAGRKPDALAAYERAGALMEDEASLIALWVQWVAMGRAYRAVGRETDAVRCFRELERRARQLRPHDPHSMRLVGLARMELGDLDAADRAYRRALKAGCWYARPEHEEVLRRLAERRQATD